MKINALIAAAGNSSRFGMPKAITRIVGRSAVDFCADSFGQIYPGEIFVTLPTNLLLKISVDKREHPLIFRPNRYGDLGYLGSIKTVIEECRDADGLFITPVDSPVFDRRLITMMMNLALYYRHRQAIIVPHWYAHAGHPVYICKKLFSALLAYSGCNGLRGFIKTHNCVFAIGCFDQNILSNFNSPRDFARTFNSMP